jgi:ABC-type transport system involved in Fe-S cluster assembly fused permease/ATPase subunit
MSIKYGIRTNGIHGKTTLCNLIARFWDVNSGEILFGKRNVKDYPSDELLSHISMVFQNVYFFNDTIAKTTSDLENRMLLWRKLR